VQRILAQDPSSDMLYFCEEASSDNNGIHARDSAGNFYTIFNGPGINGERTGLAFSPDTKRMYVSYQSPGKVRDFKLNILLRIISTNFLVYILNMTTHRSLR
jgi:secreted PhoX family phosphatase